jgi:hypothetical protein
MAASVDEKKNAPVGGGVHDPSIPNDTLDN